MSAELPYINLNVSLLNNSDLDPKTSLDSHSRLKFGSSLWQKLVHYKERKQLDAAIDNKVKDLFRDRYAFDNEEIFSRIWGQIGAKVWTPGSELTLGKLKAIDTQFREHLTYHGAGIKAPNDTADINDRVQSIVKVLLHGGIVKKKILTKETFRAVFVQHNPELMKEFAKALQKELDSLALNPPKSPEQEIVWRAFLGNIIALLPFCYPVTGDSFRIPLLQDKICKQVDYTVEVLPLPYTMRSSPMTALGLTPKSIDPTAPPMISFLGTTFPAASGFAATLLADFTPGHSVGEAVYNLNKVETIDKWMKGKENVHALGMSLGGAMTFHLLRDYHDKLARVDVYNPPGLYPEAWEKEMSEGCKVNIFCQPGDMVSDLGVWPTGKNVSLYTVYAHQDNVAENILSSHARAFTGCDKITLVKEDPTKENRSSRRNFITKLHRFLGPFLVYLPVSISLFFYDLAGKVHAFGTKLFNKEQ